MKNPIANINMKNGSKVVIELRPDIAYNEVCSFISAATKGYFNNHKIQRIVPGSWIDISYTAFNRKECQYILPNRCAEESGGIIKEPQAGDVCLGYYSENEVYGTEFVFPVRNCPDLTGKCPVFGTVIEGMDEIYRLEKVETYPVPYPPRPEIEINCPCTPQIIESVDIVLNVNEYPEPEKAEQFDFPENWPVFE